MEVAAGGGTLDHQRLWGLALTFESALGVEKGGVTGGGAMALEDVGAGITLARGCSRTR